MATKFSQLPAANALTGNEIVAIVQDGDSRRTTAQSIADLGVAGSGITIASWAFPAGAFPTSADVLYVATADHGNPGDSDYVPTGAWFIANTGAPSGFGDFYYK